MEKIIDIKDQNSLQNAAKVLKNGGILVFSTDTVYGIGCLPINKSIEKLYQIKKRPLTQPTTMIMSQKLFKSLLKKNQNIPNDIEIGFWKGKVTVIFPTNDFKTEFTTINIQNNKIGIRLPQTRWLEDLINLTGPIVTSSANKKGKPAPASFLDIDKEILEKVDLAIKIKGKLPGKPSMVYDLEENKIIRA